MLPEKVPKNQVARQDPGCGGPKEGGMQSVHILLKLAQFRWTGHVTRMPDERLPKKVFYGELEVGKCSQSGQKKRHKNTLKAPLKDFEHTTRVLGTDCTWIEQSGVASSEREQMTMKQREYAKQKESAKSQSKGIIIRIVILRIDLL